VEYGWFSNRKINCEVVFGFAVALAINAAAGIVCLRMFAVLHESERGLALRESLPSQGLADLRSALNAHRRAQIEYLAAHSESQRERCEKNWQVAEENIRSVEEKYGLPRFGADERTGFDEIGNDIRQYLSASHEAIEPARVPHYKGKRRRKSKSQVPAADLLYGGVLSALNKTFAALQAAIALNTRLAESAVRENAERYSSPRQWAEIAFAFSTLAGLVVAIVTGRSVAKAIRQMTGFARQIAAENFTEDPDVMDRADEAVELGGSNSSDVECGIAPARKQMDGAKKYDRGNRLTPNRLALAPRLAHRPGVAKIHARLLTPEEASEAQRRAPSNASSGTRA
jgi:hypothetical protein